MYEIIHIIRVAAKMGMFLGCVLLFYFSLKQCFWREGKSKVKLFLLSFVMSPLASFLEIMLVIDILQDLFSDEETEHIVGVAAIPLILLLSVSYVLLILLYAWIIGKWLKVKDQAALLFLFLMVNTISVVSLKGTGYLYADLFLRDGIDLLGTLMMFLAILLFYRLDVRTLSETTGMRQRMDWRVFALPPGLFVFLYSFYAFFEMKTKVITNANVVLSVYVFSSIIIFLFIWAFYVIIKNIKATNEAMMAKNEAVEAQNEAIKARDEVKTLSVEVMEALAHTIDAKDEYTRGHSVRVAKYSRMLAEKLGLPEEERENVYYMALLHDIGKIGVPNEIINSPTKLTDDEYAVIKTHPGVGFDILAEIKSRPDLSIGARWHHERYDGKGYPDGKSGEEIPYYARIIAVADTYDAMTSNRSYRKYMAQDAVRAEMEKNSGTQFDPDIVKCMLEIIEEDQNYELHE